MTRSTSPVSTLTSASTGTLYSTHARVLAIVDNLLGKLVLARADGARHVVLIAVFAHVVPPVHPDAQDPLIERGTGHANVSGLRVVPVVRSALARPGFRERLALLFVRTHGL